MQKRNLGEDEKAQGLEIFNQTVPTQTVTHREPKQSPVAQIKCTWYSSRSRSSVPSTHPNQVYPVLFQIQANPAAAQPDVLADVPIRPFFLNLAKGSTDAQTQAPAVADKGCREQR